MARERIHREENGLPSPPEDGGNPLPARDYRREAEASDEQLNDSMNTLAQMFALFDFDGTQTCWRKPWTDDGW